MATAAEGASTPLPDDLEEQLRGEGERQALLVPFARALLRRAPRERLAAVPAELVLAQVDDLLRFVGMRQGAAAVRVVSAPAGGTSIDVNVPDAPFLVDTVRETVTAQGLTVRLLLHPVLGVERADDGSLVRLVDARRAAARESVIHVEVAQDLDADAAEQVRAAVGGALADLRAAVADHQAMSATVGRMIETARRGTARYAAEEVDETVAFLEWLRDHHFVFLGFREYAVVESDRGRAIQTVRGSGLGILRADESSSWTEPVLYEDLPKRLGSRVESDELLVMSKTHRHSTVHRRARLEDIAIKLVAPDGSITGELRLLGLFTSLVYLEQAARTPLLRRKLRRILEAEDLIAGSHDYKAVVAIFESFPRDELFQANAEELRRAVMAVLGAEESKRVTLSVRLDPTGRNVSALVAMPRDRFNARVRGRLQALLRKRYEAESIDYHLSLGDADMAQLFFTIHVGERGIPNVSYEALEAEVVAAIRSWADEVEDLLVRRDGETRGRELA